MDEASVQLLDELIKSKLDDLHRPKPESTAPPVRGSTLFPLIEEVRTSIETQRAKTVSNLETANGAAREAHARQLKRCLQRVDLVEWLTAYTAHIGRTDLPVGLWTLVDVLAEDLLGPEADTLVAFDPNRMYSTISLGRLRNISDSSTTSIESHSDPNPIVFNLPDADPANILFSPILAHEVGHEVVHSRKLIDLVWAETNQDRVRQLVMQHLATDSGEDVGQAMAVLAGWVGELICDVIAVRLTGPSFLFALATFLPAPLAGDEVNSHPFGRDRIATALRQLDAGGWTDRIEGANPDLGVWLRQMAGQEIPAGPPAQQFLLDAMDVVIPAIETVVSREVGAPLDHDQYVAVEAEICESLDAGIPPCELSFGTPMPWQLVLAGWETAIRRHGGNAAALARAAADRQFNLFLVKTLELIRVTELWREM